MRRRLEWRLPSWHKPGVAAGESLAGPHGFFAAFGGSSSTDGLLDGLGSTFELSANTFKPYPCGIVVHPVIDACLDLKSRVDARASSMESIRLIIAPDAAALADRQHPGTDLSAQVSLQHWAVAALVFGKAGIDEARIAAGGNENSAQRYACPVHDRGGSVMRHRCGARRSQSL